MPPADVNRILRVYLGADRSGGYRPSDPEGRLRAAFAARADEMLARIAPYLSFELAPAWEFEDLGTAGAAFESAIVARYPELEADVARSLANRYTFSWR